ncbi:MAG: hypothetical protein DHS20C17_17300 [Cyclobacteriaceae bacterium]|nr:MAG: hypothetical protein DHS20C17_17300 [Cyclobacteriaceae bacterium]
MLFLFSGRLTAGDPDLFYYVKDSNDELWSVDRTTGVTTLIGATGVTDIEAIAFWAEPGNNILYAANGGDLGTLDLATGSYTFVGDVDNGGTVDGRFGAQSLSDIDGLTFDPLTGILWGSERNGGFDFVFQIDRTTGQVINDAFGTGVDYIVIDGVGVFEDVDDIAIDPDDGRMYGVSNDGTGDQIVEINKFTGSVSVVVSLQFQDVEGMSYSNDGLFYASTGNGGTSASRNRFYLVDLTTGNMTLAYDLVSAGGSDIESLAGGAGDGNLISGNLFDDVNLNGTNDAESGLSGITMNLYFDSNGDGSLDIGDQLIQTTTTDISGNYQFFVTASTINLIINVDITSLPSGYAMTTDNIETAVFTNQNGASDTGNEFGAGSGPDTDGDGIPDFVEGNASVDSDSDGVPDFMDLDSDNDGILDAVEFLFDKDTDGIPGYLDIDSDNDGIPDAIEANQGAEPTNYSSATGRIGGAVGANGIPDSAETAPESGIPTSPLNDSDGDGIVDALDLDSDNDGILDVTEVSGTDSDGNGQVDGLTDLDSDGYHDPLTSAPLVIINTDSSDETANGLTLLPDYIDLDSDGDGIDDTREGLTDAAYSLPTLIEDFDADGIIDFWDSSYGMSAISPIDHDGDGDPDYQDNDSDGDGVLDIIEGNDADSNGIADTSPAGADTDDDGIDDNFDSGCSDVNLVSGASDYAEEDTSDGSIDLGSSDLELVQESNVQVVGLLFANIGITQGATIAGASIQFEADEVRTGSVTITIQGEDIDDAPAFTSTTNDVTNRTLTTASVSWSPNDWNTVGEAAADQQTPDLAAIIQEIVNRPGWVSGNDIAIIISGPGGNRRTAETDPVLTITTSGLNWGCGTNLPLQDTDSDLNPDWRDTDDDQDGILTTVEDFNSNNNWSDDFTQGGSPVPDYLFSVVSCTKSGPVISGNADVVVAQIGSTDPDNSLGTPDGAVTRLGESDIITLDLTDVIPFNEPVTFNLSSSGSTATINVEWSVDNVSFSPPIPFSYNTGSSSTYMDFTINVALSLGARYVRLTHDSSTPTTRIDYVAYSFQNCAPDTDLDAVLDSSDEDDDNDGIPDLIELGGLDPDLDTDGDGFLDWEDSDAPGFIDANSDGISDNYDTDKDGIPNHHELDSDNDGIPDAIEANTGTLPPNMNTDGQYPIVYLQSNDTDGDGLANDVDINNGGTALAFPDSDGDTIADGLDLDSDNDGIPDTIEAGGTDADGDGLLDGFTDSDVDGVHDSADLSEFGTPLFSQDRDGDTLVDNLDRDSDADGITDIIEAAGTDSNGDGVLDTLTDTDGDGLPDLVDTDNGGSRLSVPNTDGDSLPDYQDIDSDNDGAIDNIEAQASISFIAAAGADNDSDGIDDAYDVDCAPCGAVTGMAIVPIDTESDGTDDYLDSNTDGDTVLDIIEAHDSDLDGYADWDSNTNMMQDPGEISSADVDGDGLLDDFDPDFIACSFSDFNQPANGGCASLQDRDVNGVRDWRDPSSAPLPIELIFFKAQINGNGVDLLWATGSEENNDFFTIERTADLSEWEIVKEVAGAGDSDERIDYLARDEVPFDGVSFYRLKQTDFDGQFSYSSIAKVVFTESDQVVLSPNPSRNSVNITSGKPIDPDYVILYNSLGQHLAIKSQLTNLKSVKLDISQLAPGIYQVAIKSGQELVIKRLIVTR